MMATPYPARKQPIELRRSRFCRGILLILAWSLCFNSILAAVCPIQDAFAASHSQMSDGAAPISSVSMPGPATEVGCCIFCQDCSGGGGCSHAVAPLLSFPVFVAPERTASNPEAPLQGRCPNSFSDPLRP